MVSRKFPRVAHRQKRLRSCNLSTASSQRRNPNPPLCLRAESGGPPPLWERSQMADKDNTKAGPKYVLCLFGITDTDRQVASQTMQTLVCCPFLPLKYCIHPLLASSTISPLFSISLICSQRAKWMLAGRSLAYFVVSATMFASKKVYLPLPVCLHSPRLCWQWECCLQTSSAFNIFNTFLYDFIVTSLLLTWKRDMSYIEVGHVPYLDPGVKTSLRQKSRTGVNRRVWPQRERVGWVRWTLLLPPTSLKGRCTAVASHYIIQCIINLAGYYSFSGFPN